MTNSLNTISGPAIVAMATFLSFPAAANDEANPPGSRAVYGRCEVRAETERDNFGQCNLTEAPDGKVPAGMQLVIEQVAVSCMGPLDRQVMLLALGTSLRPGPDAFVQTVIPLTRREVTTTERVSRYEALVRTRLYAGPGTQIEPYLAMEFGYVPSPKATCGVMFHGKLAPVR